MNIGSTIFKVTFDIYLQWSRIEIESIGRAMSSTEKVNIIHSQNGVEYEDKKGT